jgi:peptide chain release factor 1
MENLFTLLENKRKTYIALEEELSSTEVLSDRSRYKDKAREYAELKDVMAGYAKYLDLDEERISLEKMISEEKENTEYALMAEKELEEVRQALKEKKRALEDMLLSGDSPDHKRNVIMEIRAGTGGQEAALFAADLYKMYSRYAETKAWKISVINTTPSELGGVKEIVFSVDGHNVFKHLRFEMGTHRVQRVPETEAGGRIHTSAATVAVLPEPEDIEVDVKNQDLKIDYYRAAGAGGQHVNTTDSAVRITHLPTGIVVSCQDERSQHKNRTKAMRVLKARIMEKLQEAYEKDISAKRKKQVGSGDRSEKIRTYNFPENRVTDHRAGITLYDLANILEGGLDKLIEGLMEEDRRLKLESC